MLPKPEGTGPMAETDREINISGTGPFAALDLYPEHMSGREALSKPFEYEVTLLTEDPKLDLGTLIGEQVTVTLAVGPEQSAKRYFNGWVTRAALIGSYDRFARIRITLRPWLWLLSPRINCRIFQNMTVIDIVEKLCAEHGFSDREKSLMKNYSPREYTVQYRESDFNFINRLLEDEGIYYFF